MTWTARYIGLPFVDGGRDLRGCDCWGLVALIYARERGVRLPSYGEISASDLLRVRREIAAGAASDPWRQVDNPQPFDVAVMRLPSGRAHGHVGVVADAGHILHIEAASGSALERIDSATIRDRIIGYWRHESACE